MMVGRSKRVEGPYVDRDGIPLNLGSGSIVLERDKKWFGVGHNAVAGFNGTDWLFFHAYDAADNGRSKLRIEKIIWYNDWPVVGWRSR